MCNLKFTRTTAINYYSIILNYRPFFLIYYCIFNTINILLLLKLRINNINIKKNITIKKKHQKNIKSIKINNVIERKKDFPFRNGILSVYNTNRPGYNLKFKFDTYIISMMISGHKTIISKNTKLEFFPNFIFIPEKNFHVNIPNANYRNPTECYVLYIKPDFLEKIYFELMNRNHTYKSNLNEKICHYISNDISEVESFYRLCKSLEHCNSELDEDINEYILKEFLTRLLQTNAKQLLIQNFQNSITDKAIEKAILYIKLNFNNNITINDLTEVSGIGKTNFFKRFNDCLNMSPVNFIIKERIAHSKKIMLNGESLQIVAYNSGFNTYEHFYKSFKKFEGITPMDYKKMKCKSNIY